MGDISRHRDIFLFTRETVPAAVLDNAKLTADDLTYLELGNYLTDVSQFRDPVTYIFAKQRIWREFVIPAVQDKTQLLRGLAALGAGAGLAASQYLKTLTSGTAADVIEGSGIGVAAIGGVLALLPSDTYAGLSGADTWIDTLLGMPIERTPGVARDDAKHYGYLGEFFRLFIEGTTHLLFAQDVTHRVDGPWGSIKPIPANRVDEVYSEFFTQYYPHEHTDQPPYVWDASKRPANKLYQASRRQATLTDGEVGVMNAVDAHYVAYLAEGLAGIEDDWRVLKRDDQAGRQRLLVRTGKLLHGVEDWFFHSNVVELLELRSCRPAQVEGESDDAFLQRFVNDVAKRRPEFVAAQPAELVRLKRKLFRRLRYPAYEAGGKTQTAGVVSKTRMSTPSLRHAYPAFPSAQDTAHTLLHALENLEQRLVGKPGEVPPWAKETLEQYNLEALGGLAQPLVTAATTPKLRESIPLVLTLLSDDERRRLAANVAPEHWPLQPGTAAPRRTVKETELELQLKRHAAALEPRLQDDGNTESNYDQFVRFLVKRGRLNAKGRDALLAAFAIDRKAEQLPTEAPGAGGFLLQFAVADLQKLLAEGNSKSAELDQRASSVFALESDNGAFNEIVGSHSLMSKDTLTSVPFFEDARVLASVASSTVFTILLQQIAVPKADRRLAWEEVLHHLIRFPPSNGGWERRALAQYAPERKIPRYADLPEFARLVDSAMHPVSKQPKPSQSKRADLEERYRRLETELSRYRYP
ncbi:hypothetical protein E1263_07335 [Kribbella antibiotica]|uniref:Uncharacterized protein n=1 Tax=Kribbella antibiotica TaxID=190195 RepID=A0A4R4ZT90_9ACTN|nr:hypothetical protein [Kribbella antibiotica]TDD61506.1 hypothetical protein E1263_07335 [Kribbella antibiotica]